MHQAAAGEPDRLLTLTIDPKVGNSPEERRKLLASGQMRADVSDVAKLAAWNAGQPIKVKDTTE